MLTGPEKTAHLPIVLRRFIFAALMTMSCVSYAAAPVPNINRFANQLLPDTVDLVTAIAKNTRLERHSLHFVALSKGKDEYVYHLDDRVFIRCIKDRFELPIGRVCGDFAMVRVELMDDSMNTLGSVMAWSMIYREGRWQRLMPTGEGALTYGDSQTAELPPYAVRCFAPVPP